MVDTNKIIADFACAHGVKVYPDEISDRSYFIKYCAIINGAVYYNSEKCEPSILLHEIGHLAVLPSEIRKYIDGDVELSLLECYENDIMEELGYESVYTEKFNKLIHGDEEAIMAWQYCVARYLKINPKIVLEEFRIPPKNLIKIYQAVENTGLMLKGVSQLVKLGLLESKEAFPNLVKYFQD